MIKRIMEDIILLLFGIIFTTANLVFAIYYYCVSEWKGGVGMSIIFGIGLVGVISTIRRLIKTAKSMDMLVAIMIAKESKKDDRNVNPFDEV